MPVSSPSPGSARQRWSCLLLGTFALCFSNGVTAHAAAAWFAPLLLLRYATTARLLPAAGLLASAIAIASGVTMRGVIPVSPPEFLVTCLVSGVLGTLPYLGHRLLAPRLGPVAGSLVFPAANVSLLYLLSAGGPFGTWGVDAYVQVDVPLLPQFAAVAGIWGVSFLVFWFASAMQCLFPPRGAGNWNAIRAFVPAFVLALAFGTIRVATAPAPVAYAGVAALTAPPGLPDRFFDGCTARSDFDCRDAGARKRMDALFSQAAMAAKDGASLIVWPEAGVQYDARLEHEFIARAGDFARTHHAYLVAGVARVPDDAKAPLENKAMVFTPAGGLAFEYHKAVPVPGEPIVAGDGAVKAIDTPFGRLGVIICFDADFPMLVRKAGQQGVDVLAIPANDWRAITPMHGEMARYRAIENGFSIVRAASNGLSLAAGPDGKVLARVDAYSTPGAVASARLAVTPRSTWYSRTGDVFAIACMLLLGGLALVVAAKRLMLRKQR